MFELSVPRIFDTAFNEVSRIFAQYSITLVLAFTLFFFFWCGEGGKNNQLPSHALIFKVILWHVPMSSAPGQPGYLMPEHKQPHKS
jgi:hypothetical protein